ncbi:MAG: polyphosphate kinase 1 [Oscillospiraceae bacterium]|jgi:polyphosphate kinase|nr:polyphosphate kinase 1 [Oscillospiraceae bacterium]
MKFIKPYIDNRELSWLKFNRRVLEEAQDASVPLFERLRFVYIFCNNLDEFFMIRVGYLRERKALKKDVSDNKTNLTASEQLKLITKKTAELIPVKDKVYAEIISRLNRAGIEQVDLRGEISKDDERFLAVYFKSEILPLLTPAIIDKKNPVPFLKNKEIYIAATLKAGDSPKRAIGILPAVPSGAFERVVWLPPKNGKSRFALVESLIMRYADMVYADYEIIGRNVFRITRNADVGAEEALYDHDLDFRGVMEELLKKRKKSAPVRIEFDSGDRANEAVVAEYLNLGLSGEYAFSQSAPLDMGFIFQLEERIKAYGDLFFKPLTPRPCPRIRGNEPIIRQMERGDILLSYPYESINPFIRLLEEAANDKDVFSVKITLYRVATDSKVVNALIAAAENGKRVLALVELRARFDEENNIGWSKRLEDAGVRVVYGPGHLKVHSKLLLITKKTGSSVKYFTQIGTGNYNERTSRLYTDLSLLTANRDIGSDASVVFNALSAGNTVETANLLWVAPRFLKSRAVRLIDAEITRGAKGYIGLKLNSLTDKDIIEKLVEASRSGVKIDLIVRGICCLVAGVPGYTENIRVVSVVGRFLEHSRVYIFGAGERSKVYISSADFMTRNTEKRIEVAAPVRDALIKKSLIDDFNVMLSDDVKARVQKPDGSYAKVKADGGGKLDSQIYFYERAYERARLAAEKKIGGNKIIGFIKGLFNK